METKLTIPMHPTKSTNVDSWGFDLDRKVLRVKFMSGATYDYHDVSPEVASAFQISKSMGTFIALHVRGKFVTTLFEAKPEKKPAPEAAQQAA